METRFLPTEYIKEWISYAMCFMVLHRSFLEKDIRLITAIDLIKWHKNIKLQRWLLTCAPISKLPSNKSTMICIAKKIYYRNRILSSPWYLFDMFRILCSRLEWIRWFDLFKAVVYIDNSFKFEISFFSEKPDYLHICAFLSYHLIKNHDQDWS